MLASLLRPIHGSEATRTKWAGLCVACTTDAERAELLRDLSGDVLARLRR